MRAPPTPLLCELHAHTTWSDGALGLGRLVDLYGQSGFDVLCITDHVIRSTAPWDDGSLHVTSACFDAYLEAIRTEAERAFDRYEMIVLPGLELTFDDPDPRQAGHAVAIGLERFVGVDDGLERALVLARSSDAALIAVHPYEEQMALQSNRGTARFAVDRELAPLVDRFELINRHEVFQWVVEAKLPVVASGDFHHTEHLVTWKTLLPCARRPDAVVEYLRSSRPAFLVPVRDAWHAEAA